MSSDNILLNSPALHSLKRNQLVQLCKRHGIKAIGKNPELIGKLQEYGRDHPSAIDSQLRRGEGNAEETHSGEIVAPRPSETWSLIEEPPEQEYRTHFQNLSTINEFGTGESSSKSSSVTSSIKALATLLHGSFSSSKSNLLASSSMTSLPAPTETRPSSQLQDDDVKEFEPFNEPEPEPEPNTSINSVYMNEAGLASTVRLVGKPPSSPDYAMPSPFRGKSVIFPSSSPISPTFDKTESFQTPDSHSGGASSDHVLPSVSQPSDALPGTPHASPDRQASPKFNLALTHSTTEFTFRSPMPGVSMDETKKASLRAEILQEMNRRLLVTDPPATITVGFFNEASKKRAREPEPAPEAAGYSRFVAAHEREFNKMPSILDDRARGSSLELLISFQGQTERPLLLAAELPLDRLFSKLELLLWLVRKELRNERELP
ncbi:uncharacterized protein EI90DRAFT_1256426 [Cantharellus anzutake]|uniref:uncharacterized protein n=1 Tax=Cantharellus anzutake TaxID=1750568 RepID=UPI0019082762|nr:uncharacterized protein EI90DRAFT_1256426 [Cantharellus anzutake]KAF8329990.1 hypothetical protein EI90DRAFT_1256426 [Cantharellus anzutake]